MGDKLSKQAYGGVEGSKYSPYITSKKDLKELTPLVVMIGIGLAILFAASNAYTALASGMTVAAGIPGAILGAGLFTILTKKFNVLNTNVAQGMSSAGESMASGITFVLPAILLIGQEIGFLTGVLVGVTGAIMGIGITALVHNFLIIEEHGKLIYPEGMAISETVVTTESGGDGLKTMLSGAAVGGFLTAVSTQIIGLISTSFSLAGEKVKWQWTTDANPLLLGIGFIVGMDVAVMMFAGTVLANFAVIPLIGYFGQLANDTAAAWNNPELLINSMSGADIQGTYTKYIGAGMMLAGGLIGAIRLIPVIIASLKSTFKGTKGASGVEETEGRGTTGILLLIGMVLLITCALLIASSFLMIVVSLVLIFIFCFLFSIVAARMTGNIGTSNLPVSGMTIASLLVVTVTFVIFGNITGSDIWTSKEANVIILLALTTVVAAIANSGGYAQTQKVTFILGGSKNNIQKVYALATVFGVIATVGVMFLLKDQILNTEGMAPQASLMAAISEGILSGNLPWTIIFIGVFIAVVLQFLGVPIMTVALGFYLPMGTVTIITIGALINAVVKRVNKNDPEQLEAKEGKGTIFSSGLIAGGAIIGLIGAFLAVFAPGGSMQNYFFYLGGDAALLNGNVFSLIAIVLLVVITFVYINKKVIK
jgi:putative OPT family oligopeptide transporter